MERHLVDVLNKNVDGRRRQQLAIGTPREKPKRESRAHANDVQTIKVRTWRRARPTSAEQRDLVSGCGESTEYLVEVRLGAPRLWILAILPVHDVNPQSDAPQSTGDGVEHSVYEARALLTPETLGEAHTLLNDHARRRGGQQELRHAEAQDCTLYSP
jgi:hypothetical protein